MNDQRKPSDDFKEGLSLLFRAVKSAAQQVDVGKVDKTLNQVITEAGQVVTKVGKVVAEEVNRMSKTGAGQGQVDEPRATGSEEEKETVVVEPTRESEPPKSAASEAVGDEKSETSESAGQTDEAVSVESSDSE